MKLLLATMVLLTIAPPTHEMFKDIGGNRFVVDTENVGYFMGAVTLSVRRAGQTLATIPVRSLIDEWLKTDTLWSSHSLVNDLRYLDNPRPGKSDQLHGKVLEGVPSEGGCLLRIGLINIGRSSPRIDADVILGWKRSQPNRWLALYGFGDNYLPEDPQDRAIRLPRYRGVHYLLENDSVYRLSSDPLKRKLLANLPPESGQAGQWDGERHWFGLKQAGRHLIICQPNYKPHSTVYKKLDLLTGNISPISDRQLKRLGLTRPTTEANSL